MRKYFFYTFVSAFFFVMTLDAIYVSLAVGVGLRVASLIAARPSATQVQGAQVPGTRLRLAAATPAMRAGLALVLAPVFTIVLVTAAMAGLFSQK
ncbi:hypothetical protein [Herbaspirillum sp. ST 5-3]|uniref:hypothetical protein n=1 Tax=Oxalobacteraceae TaxID=75682 RepID=UPI0010A55CD0|nr:hypothetical protein [Herbaspirillum sp. ST 5-3]